MEDVGALKLFEAAERLEPHSPAVCLPSLYMYIYIYIYIYIHIHLYI